MEGNAIFFLCTRDRPESLRWALSSLTNAAVKAFPAENLRCYVLDDSTKEANSQLTKDIADSCTSRTFCVHVIANAEQSRLDCVLKHCAEHFATYHSTYTRKLGKGSWDLAGVRNLAFLLAYSLCSPDDIAVFVDDDIVFESVTLLGHSIEVDGVKILKELCAALARPEALVAGTGLWGRLDTSVAEHIRLTFDRLGNIHYLGESLRLEWEEMLTLIAGFPNSIPFTLNLPTIEIRTDGPGISGGAMAVKPAALRSLGLPRTYNEDWIWLSLLGGDSSPIHRIAYCVAHVSPKDIMVDEDFVVYQSKGEIMYTAIRQVLKEAMGVHSRIAWVREHLKPNHFDSAKDIVEEDLKETLTSVEQGSRVLCEMSQKSNSIAHLSKEAFAGARKIHMTLSSAAAKVRCLSSRRLCNEIIHYLNTVPTWEALLAFGKKNISKNMLRGEAK